MTARSAKVIPIRKSPRALAALEIAEAGPDRTRANARWEQAIKAGIAAGAIPDVKANPRAPGTIEVFSYDEVRIVLTVVEPSTRLDQVKFTARLLKLGLTERQIAAEVKRCTVKNAAAHVFTASVR